MLLDRLLTGGKVTIQELREVLSHELLDSYLQDQEQARWERGMAEAGRQVFADYNRKLRIANMLYGRCEQLSCRRSPRVAQLSNKVDEFYELAIEALQETLSRDRSAEMYVESGYSDDPNESTISLCPDGMPRMIYRASNIATRDELKLQVLTRAITEAYNSYGIGEHDRRSGGVLTADTQAFRLYHQRNLAIQKAQDEKAFRRRHPTFSKLFGD